jgi:signal transduction histidine kinase/CheY-like chemotaxis protein/HPt (histidine-containing phosphotransfer) domain-containing protein
LSLSPGLARALGIIGGAFALGAAGLLALGVALPPLLVAGVAGIGGLIAVAAALGSGSAAPPPSRREPVLQALDPAELQQLREDLAQARRLERELSDAKHSAEAAMMAKGEFLATMSHEIRTPLNGIIPLLDILLSTRLGDDQRDYLNTALQSAQQLLRIVDDILDYSKLEANKLELEAVGVNLRELLDSVMRLMDSPAEAKHLRLSVQIDPAVRLAVRGDPVRLRQILTNLLSNAIKFTDRGGVSVMVSRRGESRTHHEIRFEITDTGVGIAPEAAARLFKAFSQADASTTRTFGGTGLGLVICKRIVDLMGGQIGVESSPGRGSTFWFQVPLLKAMGDIDVERRELGGSRVLLVTADAALQRKMGLASANWGITLVNASGAQDALFKLRAAGHRAGNWAFHLLLVDLVSVRTTAVGLHRSILREDSLAKLQIVYLKGDEPAPGELAEGGRSLPLARNLPEPEMRRQLGKIMEGEVVGGLPVHTAADVHIEAAPSRRPPPEPAPMTPAWATPPAPSPSPATHTTAAPASATLTGAAAGPLSGRALLVEDNPVNRQVALRILSLAGLDVDAAENGQEALDRLKLNPYALVLMDCQMPVMDGYTASRERRRIEAQSGLARVPIIAMTANAMIGDREKCLDAGMDDYLTKPLDRQKLTATLTHWLQQSPYRGVAAPVAAAARAPSAREAPSPPPTARPTPAPAPAPVVVASRPALDQTVIEDLREVMGDEFLSLIRVFLEDTPRTLERLQAAAAAGEIPPMVAAAHSLKSTSANLGALEMSELARQIEHGGRAGTLSNPTVLAARLVAEFIRVEGALRALLG